MTFWRVFSVFFWRCQSSRSVFLFVFFLLYIFCFLKFFYGFGFVFWASLVAQTANSTQCRRPGFDPWVRRIPWRREWLPTPGFLPGESQGQKSLPGYSACSHKESDTTQGLTLSLFTKDASQFSGSLVSLSCRGLSLNEN